MPELSLVAAFLVGLLGGGHCAGMCGGIVGAVSLSMPGSKPRLSLLLGYNLGRIGSYTLAGVVAGALGATSFFLQQVIPIEKILYAVANIMLIVLGLYLAGIWHGVVYLERLGSRFWKMLQPLGKNWLPVRSLPQALMLGAIWGWLPCGLVYSVLVAAIATADPLHGGLLMLAFGLGTLPTLLVMGLAALRLKQFLQNIWIRRVSGVVVVLFGLIGLLQLY
ncbi:sulfite exporter TauE/SafE family protein [Methylobacillus gramineus]|uniref:sulfite exporter TauE/SafE family protein n=1 Tax=Methylobacillus gramineus TaxID=755169 RepID=UPI001CFF9D69|nr:sulfite exporter TauE/SafE family protein [Methylobacillus gramineus]MCB5185986.1 sulfite exporter TauE/SafE family protein [Methylobacillus gramineus]